MAKRCLRLSVKSSSSIAISVNPCCARSSISSTHRLGIRAAAARHDARVRVEREGASERKQVARGGREAVQVALEGAWCRAHDALTVPQRQAADVAQVHLAIERPGELHHRVLPLADPDEVEGGQIPERALDLERHVRTAHRDRHALVALPSDLGDERGDVVVERDRADAHQLGAEARHAPLDLLGRRVREEQVQDLHLVALGAQGGGQVGKGHEEARTLRQRVRGIDQQNAHAGLGNAGSRRDGDAVHPRPAPDLTRSQARLRTRSAPARPENEGFTPRTPGAPALDGPQGRRRPGSESRWQRRRRMRAKASENGHPPTGLWHLGLARRRLRRPALDSKALEDTRLSRLPIEAAPLARFVLTQRS